MGGAVDSVPAIIQVVTVTGLDGVDVVVGGEIDLDSCRHLETHLEAALASSERDLRVDLCEVTFLDSSGLRVLTTLHEQLADLQRRLIISNPSSAVARVLEVSGMSQVLNVKTAEADSEA